MTEFWKFWYDSSFLSFIAVLGLSSAVYTIACIPNRILRHLNIRKHGWPPEYLDADGDYHGDDKDEED